jgi:hypothetical protein
MSADQTAQTEDNYPTQAPKEIDLSSGSSDSKSSQPIVESSQAAPALTPVTPSKKKRISIKLGLPAFMKRNKSPKNMSTENSTPNQPGFLKRHAKKIILFFVLLVILISIPAAVGFYSYQVALEMKSQVAELAVIGRGSLDKFKAQDLPGTESELKRAEEQLKTIQSTYQKLSFYRNIPIASAYYQDGEHGLNAAESGMQAGLKGIAAIAPYADVLGFSGEGTFEGGAAENRVKLILQTLEKVTPELDAISADLEKTQSELSYIDTSRALYQREIGGMIPAEKIGQGKELLGNASKLLSDYRPIIENMPKIAGGDGERKKYLVLFQNDNELRPTGGFLTAYTVIFIEDGVVTPEKSDDIYELDKKFTKKIAIPDALGRYLTTEKYFNLRDMNVSPDFRLSMDLFYEHYSGLRGEPDNIDGIIAVDTQVLNDLVSTVGPVEVPGYGTFTAEIDPACECPQIIHVLSEIITRPTPYLRTDRKGILAPLMQSVLKRIYQSPRTFMDDLFKLGINGIDGRHIQLYFFDEELQAAAESINAAGRMQLPEDGTDFLGIVNANLGGAKSNLYVGYDVTQTITGPENGQITKDIEIKYRNPRRADNCDLEAGLLCLNSTLRDWTRIYLPEGAKLVNAQGFNEEPNEYEEEGFHVIDGFFILEPKGQATLKLTYTVPYDKEDYQVKIWKQGGTDPIEHLIDVNGVQEKVTVGKDTDYQVEF